MERRTYIAIDLKSFYASVECVERGLDPLDAHLVVADESRTEKTICLAVSPALKAMGVPGRPRLFEVVQWVKGINAQRQKRAPGRQLLGASHFASELRRDPALALDYVVAPPRMAFYIEYSTRIYQIYLNYVDEKDIHVYSIDEVFIDATEYLKASGLTARDLAMEIILDVLRSTGITATAGIGPNLYLCKVAMDVWAKHIEPDENSVRIAELDEMSYRRQLWNHRPLTDFWRVGRGYARKLEEHGMFTMGDVARQSVRDEDVLYDLFGVNAELLIDLGLGALHHRKHQGVPARFQQHRLRSGAVLRLFLREGQTCRPGDGRRAGAGAGGQASHDRSAGAGRRLRQRQRRRRRCLHGRGQGRPLRA